MWDKGTSGSRSLHRRLFYKYTGDSGLNTSREMIRKDSATKDSKREINGTGSLTQYWGREKRELRALTLGSLSGLSFILDIN